MKKCFKTLLSTSLAVCLVVCSCIVCLAAEEKTEAESYADFHVLEENGVRLPLESDEIGTSRDAVINGPNMGTTTGYISSSFTVPDEYSGHMIRFHWKATPAKGANNKATFKLYVTGNGLSYTIYLPCNTSAQAYTIANLPAGRYSISISPHTNVSGEYVYAYQVYAY